MDMDALIERAHRGEATAAELASLAAWRAADERNEAHHRDVLRILDAAAVLRAELTAATPPSAFELLARRSGVRQESATQAAGGPTHIGPRRPPARRSWRGHVPWGIAAAALLLLVVNVFRQPDLGTGAAARYAEIVTGVGEIATVQLGDGSVVRLAPDSRLRLGQDGDDRQVALDGRAFFSVAHVAGTPFRVVTAAGTARVLGTRFELRTSAAELELVVVEGRVALEAPQNSVVVAAGQASAVINGVATEPNAIEDGAGLLRWTGRFLAFQNTPLRDAAREIEAMYRVRLTITDPTLREQTVTAVFTGQDLEAVLAVICEIVNARCVVRDDEVTVSPR
jgi:ferric-dicitrate binding protein FerR (iron transport regulator)